MSLVEIPDPPGYKVVGYDMPKKGQLYSGANGRVCQATFDYANSRVPIVEPVVAWRDATLADLERAPVKCRAQNEENGPWFDKVLIGYFVGTKPFVWLTDDFVHHVSVQVVDESSTSK